MLTLEHYKFNGDREDRKLRRKREPTSLSGPQIKVLRALYTSNGPMSRHALSDRCGFRDHRAAAVQWAVGYSDPAKRARFEATKAGGGSPEQPFPSLLTRGYVTETVLDIDGYREIVLDITDDGRRAYEAVKDAIALD